jgi:signal transduction histidine kinase/CHASE3 domain sensor protein
VNGLGAIRRLGKVRARPAVIGLTSVRLISVPLMGVGLMSAGAAASVGRMRIIPDSSDFMPHGFCYLWNPLILWLHVASDGLIALSYYCIPAILIYFIRKNRDIPFNRIFWMFGTFILACGTTHLIEIWNVWHGNYLLAGVIKAFTAAASVVTAGMLIPFVPKVISLPQRFHLQEVNQRLERQIAESLRLEAPIETSLRRWVTGGFVLAVLLTGFLGILSWRIRVGASREADLAAHAHSVIGEIETVRERMIEVEIDARNFNRTNTNALLDQYRTAHEQVTSSLQELRQLTADNPRQKARLEALDAQISDALGLAQSIVAGKKQMSVEQIGQSVKVIDAMCAISLEMEGEETGLLNQRAEKVAFAKRLTNLITALATLLGAGFLTVAGFTVHRQIDIGVAARTQVALLNSGLERRVEQRTAALQFEIAERKRAEERLAAQAEQLGRSREALESQTRMLKLVLDSMGEGLVAADGEGRFFIWNDAADRLMGRGAEDLPTQEWTPHYKVYLPDGVTPYPADSLPLVRAMRGESVQAELMIEHPDRNGGAFLEVIGRPLKDAEGNLCGGVAVLRDITERAVAERKIQRLNQELEARVIERTAELETANRELEAFTYSVSHDLRAPLRHINGFTRILVEEFGPALPAEAQRHLERIEHGAQRMGQLVDELLNLARVGRQALAIQVTGLNAVVRDVVSLLAPETEDRRVEWRIAELPFVECDPVLIQQVFQNLIGNALKYSRPRTQAVIEIGQTETEGIPAIFIKDNGVGFSMKYADKLFGVFQRLHRAEDFEGTGVGLATVHRIVQKHGGRVWADAELDRGATFYFTLGGQEHSASGNASAAAGG